MKEKEPTLGITEDRMLQPEGTAHTKACRRERSWLHLGRNRSKGGQRR